MTGPKTPRGRRLVGVLAGLTLVALLIGVGATVSNPSPTLEAWKEGEERGRFRAVYDGHGSVSGNDNEILLEPKSADDLSMTHGGLVVTTQTWNRVDFDVVVTTEAQVRRDPANPWEVGWVLWNYTDDDHFYAVALKPNGWEVSKQDPAYPGKQRFLVTGDQPRFPIGESQRVSVTQSGAEMVISVGGRVLARVVDEEAPYRNGSIGFYTEDARVRFTDLSVHEESK